MTQKPFNDERHVRHQAGLDDLTRFPGSGIIAATFLVVALAGCAGSDGTKREQTVAPPAVFDDATGAIQGRVLDDESQPVNGAEVGLLQSGKGIQQTATSAADGAFSFSNLAPGAYNVLAQRLGFDPASRTVEVVAGSATPVNLVLVAIAIATEYRVVWTKPGYFDCNWQIIPPALIGGTAGPCGSFPVVGNVTQISSLFDNNKRAYEYQAKPGLMSVVHELSWKQGSYATGEKLAVTLSYANRTGYHWFCKRDGGNPLKMEWQRAEELGNKEKGTCVGGTSQYGTTGNEMPTVDFNKDLKLRSFVSTGPARSPAGGDFSYFALAYQQHFEVTFSLFYHGRAPDGYSALKDQ